MISLWCTWCFICCRCNSVTQRPRLRQHRRRRRARMRRGRCTWTVLHDVHCDTLRLFRSLTIIYARARSPPTTTTTPNHHHQQQHHTTNNNKQPTQFPSTLDAHLAQLRHRSLGAARRARRGGRVWGGCSNLIDPRGHKGGWWTWSWSVDEHLAELALFRVCKQSRLTRPD